MSIGLIRLAAVWACTTWTLSAQAAAPQWSPERIVEIIVPSGPGGGTDRTGRTVQGLLENLRLVERSNVVNKPGAGGNLGYFYLSQQTGGHHVSVTTVAVLTSHITGRSKLNHTDLTPLAQLFSEYLLFAVRADSPYKTGAEILERMKQDPQSVSIGITVVGGTSHMAMGSILRRAGGEPRNLKTVVFKSGGEVTTALLGGHVDLVPAPVGNLLPHVNAGKLRAVAVSAPRRLPRDLAAVPTWHELGAKTDFDTWRGIIGPKGMRPEHVAFWDKAFSKMVQDAGWKKDLEKHHWEDNYLQSSAASRYLGEQYRDFKTILIDLGLVK